MFEDRFGISFSIKGIGVQVGQSDGDVRGSGYDLAYSYIGSAVGNGTVLKTSVEIDSKGDAKFISVPIEADSVSIKTGGNLLLETVQKVYDERSNFVSWNAGVNIGFIGTITPTGSYNQGLGSSEKKWAEIPAWIKGNSVYVDVGEKCELIGGGILGSNVTLNAKSLDWTDVYNKNESQEKSYGFDSGVVTIP